jgi:hypothetical protein
MTATYTFDVFASLDGYGSYNERGDWGGYWGKQGRASPRSVEASPMRSGDARDTTEVRPRVP